MLNVEKKLVELKGNGKFKDLVIDFVIEQEGADLFVEQVFQTLVDNASAVAYFIDTQNAWTLLQKHETEIESLISVEAFEERYGDESMLSYNTKSAKELFENVNMDYSYVSFLVFFAFFEAATEIERLSDSENF